MKKARPAARTRSAAASTGGAATRQLEALAARAEKGRTARIVPAPNRGAAMARLALAAVDPPLLREIAELARGAGIVAQGRAASLDRRRQHRPNRLHQPLESRPCDAPGGARRGDAGHVQRLADVDVAKPGD